MRTRSSNWARSRASPASSRSERKAKGESRKGKVDRQKYSFARRIVAGHDRNGKAIVVEDGLAPSVRTLYVLIDGEFDPALEAQFKQKG